MQNMQVVVRRLGSARGVLSVCQWPEKHSLLRRLSAKAQSPRPILSVAPIRALVDEKFKVSVENLPPAAPVTVHSLHQSEDQDCWEAYGHYISDHRGTVSVSEDLSFGGTYSGKEPMGLLWSMRPVPGSRFGLRLRKMDVCAPMLVNISVFSGHEGFREHTPLASVVTERWHVAPGVQRVEVTIKGMRGTLFIPPGLGAFPGVLDIWGGGGGLPEYRAALLASHGYATMALENFALDDLQGKNLDLNYFEMALDKLKNHPQVISDRVGVVGLSLGAIFLLYLTAKSPTFKPQCCVSISGSNVWSSDNTLKGVYKTLFRKFDKLRLGENDSHIWQDVGLEFIHDPTNVVDMTQMLRSAGKEHLVTSVIYYDAGHLIEPPFSPHFRATAFKVRGNEQNVIMLWGGHTKPHADAQEDSWTKILTFLKQHLYSSD
ncbi:bile acid-CoA:amino acid N-acyltransferase-like isoform X2 [Betta splendens]|uniref:Bile acid-CoA:amino acid N-acyltransferase-like isoform X2 n=1 Tax=Betta splendens TaxID=158456 RepID=A0A6P7NBP9_BETSP|nr:bile acid-CoA:amino acid N-acyltransferase-like isoform X2 [Betta splendens]